MRDVKRIQKIGIGIAVGVAACVIVVMSLGFWVEKKAQTFFYPLAPPMPAVVSESMPEILTRLESVLKTDAPQVLVILRPGISSNQISQLEQQYHVNVPDDIKAIYEWRDGAKLAATNAFADLIPGHHFESLENMLAENVAEGKATATATSAQQAFYRFVAGQRDHWYCLFDDGAGDGYFFDPTRKPADGAIFSTFTEEGYFLFFPSARNLMAGVASCYEQGAYRVKPGSKPLQLDEDFEQTAKIWTEFGANNQEGPSSN